MTLRLRLLLITLVVLAYASSLGGELVWDDRDLLTRNPLLVSPFELLVTSVWEGTGKQDDLYRPLVMLSHALVQAVVPGPGLERLVNLGLHVGVTLMLAEIAVLLGAGGVAATGVAAMFGVHPGVSEPVAWITGRHDLLPAALMVGAWWALARGAGWVAGGLLGLAVFGKEPYLLGVCAPIVWWWARSGTPGPHERGPLMWASALAGAGATIYLWIRQAIGLPLPVGAASVDPLGSLGALLGRFVTLLLVPGAPDVAPSYVPSPALGGVGVLLGLGLVILVRGRLWLAPMLGAALLVLPAAPASAQIGLVADRYFYLCFAALVPAVAGWVERGGRRAAWVGGALVVGLGITTASRAMQWHDDHTIFSASIQRDPENPYAAFHLGTTLQREGDCAAALPLLTLARPVEARAGTNLQACLIELGRLEEAVALGSALVAEDPLNANVARNTARALARLGRPEEALRYAELARARDGGLARSSVLIGQILGQLGRLDEAEIAFDAALSAEPGHPDAVAGLAAVARVRARAATPGSDP